MEPYDVIVNQPVVIDNVSRYFVVTNSVKQLLVFLTINMIFCQISQ
jgi:hypothetical protein